MEGKQILIIDMCSKGPQYFIYLLQCNEFCINIYLPHKFRSNLYIKSTEENLKMCPLLAVALYKHYSFNGENGVALYIE